MQTRIKTLTYAETEKLLEQLKEHSAAFYSHDIKIRNYTMALLMLDAGLRVGEVCRLKIGDLFWNNEPFKSIIILAEISKNNRERQIPVSGRLSEALKEMNRHYWLQTQARLDWYAFYSHQKNQNFTTRQVERIILSAGSKSLGKRVTPHMLRHTFATRIAKKVNLRVVQELLGHKSITSTQIYTHPDSEDLQNAINHLNGNPC